MFTTSNLLVMQNLPYSCGTKIPFMKQFESIFYKTFLPEYLPSGLLACVLTLNYAQHCADEKSCNVIVLRACTSYAHSLASNQTALIFTILIFHEFSNWTIFAVLFLVILPLYNISVLI